MSVDTPPGTFSHGNELLTMGMLRMHIGVWYGEVPHAPSMGKYNRECGLKNKESFPRDVS